MPVTVNGVEYMSKSEREKAVYDRKFGPKPKRSNAESQASRIRNLKMANDSLQDQNNRLENEIKSLRMSNALLNAAASNRGYSFGKADIDADMLKRLIRLCHPDKHGNSQTANEVTAWLLKQRI